MAEAQVFADGEPVDPIKLQALQSQITEIKEVANASFNLSSKTLDGTTSQYVYHSKSGVEEFEKVEVNKLYSQAVDVSWSADYDGHSIVATPRKTNPDKYDIRVTVTGDATPTIYVYYAGKKGDPTIPVLKVNWISVARKLISAS